MISIVTFLTSACSNISFFAANFPSTLLSNQSKAADISYGTKPWQKLDIYTPDSFAAGNPVIIFFYGGGWSYGEKSQYKFLADAFTEKGFTVVIPDYVKYPEGKFPEFEDNAAQAIAWTMHNINHYKGNKNNVYVMGHSAGAYIGAMVVSDAEYLKAYGLKPKDIRAFIGLSGPYSFTPDEEKYKRIFSAVAYDYSKMHIDKYINGDEPPMFLLYGRQDNLVGIQNVDRLTAALKKHNVSVQTKIYENLGHLGTISSFTRILRAKSTVRDDIIQYINSLKK